MLAAVAGASHPAVAALLGLGAAGLAGGVVAMAWNVHARQIRLAGQLARRQVVVTAEAATGGRSAEGAGSPHATTQETGAANGSGLAPPVIIDGPDTVVIGEQARYRVRPSANRKVTAWSAGGGSVAQSPDPARPDELLLIADRPGNLTISARVREGMTERRGTKPVTAVPDVTAPAPPFTLRLFLDGWGLLAIAILITGFAGALAALGNLASSDFIALAAPLAALLAVVAIARGAGDTTPRRHGDGNGNGTARPAP